MGTRALLAACMTCLVPACAALGQAAAGAQPATSQAATTAAGPAPVTYGWRGNWTGLYPGCTAPAEWGRIAKGVTAGMTCQAARPAEGAGTSGMAVDRGFIRDWLVLGPLPVKDSVKEFPAAQVPDEPKLAPAEGQKVGELAWTRLEIKKKPDYECWGTTEMEWLDLGKAVGFKPNQVAYAFTYLYCEHPGTAVMVVDHGHGFKAWINGQEAYSNPARDMALGNYVGISRYKQELRHGKSPSFKLTFAKGWNRLLVKVGTDNHKTWEEMRFTGRLYDPDPTAYEDKNIAWMTKLPERTNACPLIVGDRIFTPAEPDELICLDKATGKVLWRRFNTLYDATPQADRDANPVFKDKIAPLMEELAKNEDYEKGLELRRKLQTLLVSVDKAKYTLKWDGHFAAHFGIVGFTTTPVSDGKNVYAFFGYGVVACYDMDGNRKWIRRLEAKELVYSCSPALAGGKLMCVFGGLHGLDAATGDEAWMVPGVGCTASLIPLRVNGTDAVTIPAGVAYAASDGRVVWKNPQLEGGKGGGWGAGAFVDNKFYLNFLGVASFTEADFTGVAAEPWKAKMRYFEIEANHHRPNGEWLDRSSPASPLIVNGVNYAIDEYGMLYALDLKTGKTYYQQETGFDELHSYVHIGVAASPTLIGKNIVVMDNQGCALVFEPGPTFKKVAMNRIETMLPRDWPIPPQEITANSPPVCDGERIYIRGEQYMYCVGRK